MPKPKTDKLGKTEVLIEMGELHSLYDEIARLEAEVEVWEKTAEKLADAHCTQANCLYCPLDAHCDRQSVEALIKHFHAKDQAEGDE